MKGLESFELKKPSLGKIYGGTVTTSPSGSKTYGSGTDMQYSMSYTADTKTVDDKTGGSSTTFSGQKCTDGCKQFDLAIGGIGTVSSSFSY